MKPHEIETTEVYVNLHQDLIEECKRGDQKAQFQIYKLYYKAMFNTSLRIVNNPMEAEDIIQESFLSVFEKIDTYSGKVSFGAWLKRIVINSSISSIRKDRTMIFEDIDTDLNLGDEYENKFSQDEENFVMAERIKKVIERLPVGFSIIISQYLLVGYDHNEISEILLISPCTSKSQYSRARQKILLSLNEKGPYRDPINSI